MKKWFFDLLQSHLEIWQKSHESHESHDSYQELWWEFHSSLWSCDLKLSHQHQSKLLCWCWVFFLSFLSSWQILFLFKICHNLSAWAMIFWIVSRLGSPTRQPWPDPDPTRQEPWVGRTSSNGQAAGSGQGRICLTRMDMNSPMGLVGAGFSGNNRDSLNNE